MVKINENFLKMEDSYLFSTVANKVSKYQQDNPDKNIIKLGIGDVTKPIANKIIEQMKKAVDELGKSNTFRGYGPEQGYEFLRKAIVKYDYERRGIQILPDEVFISDGSKCDCGNIVDLFDINNKIAITDPVYPVYLDTNIISGRTGKYNTETGRYDGVIYIPCTYENDFIPELPQEIPDIIYLCFPNNPTGTVISKEELARWVKYAKENNSIILYDAAYEAFITEENIPHTIYEIEGAKEVAIEFKSFSKTAGFTGIRCAYTIVPKELKIKLNNGKEVSLNKLWNRRQCTKFNGVSYITQRAAEAIYTEEGQKEIKENIKYYLENAKIIREGLDEVGIQYCGGINSPYIWIKVPNNMKSWEFFDMLLEKANIVGTPGVGFGPSGEGYFRLTAFGERKNTEEAMKRIKETLQF
ncbi:MAG TPA: LL-diaminopimelate aminotransferase [Clostridiaceae bacterium]|jgi:LL-diaminopimelate aminotransferase|nr:LL-diaminopimelate aminotransferase [Clostridium sp.]MEE0127622.1 LL-diaminopimelate aminotransferase [Clostridia bacterium]HJJ12391.1 LL-diaminopimelate aminotransferase [Clostridiaceae bacterium]